MTIRTCLAKTIPAPWYRVLGATGLLACVGLWAAVAVRPANLASLVRAYRDSPTPARRAAVESFAAAHSKDASGALAQLALGVVAYEHKDYPAAIAALRKSIDAAREAFRPSFFAPCSSMVDYLHLELVHTLANDDPDLLGDNYPGPMV